VAQLQVADAEKDEADADAVTLTNKREITITLDPVGTSGMTFEAGEYAKVSARLCTLFISDPTSACRHVIYYHASWVSTPL
jgi:hypothetical protein